LLRALPFLNYTPSQVSAAALALAFYTLGSSVWNRKMQNTFGYKMDELKEIIIHLSETHNDAQSMQQQAIQEKYKASKHHQVSLVSPKSITIEKLEEIISGQDDDILNSTADNIESMRQKTEMLLN